MRAILALALLIACGDPPDEGHGHDHDHGHDDHGHDHGHGDEGHDAHEGVVHATMWHEGVEVYSEYESVAPGEPITVTARFTNLETHAPLDAPSATVRVGNRAPFAADRVSPGVFRGEFTLEHGLYRVFWSLGDHTYDAGEVDVTRHPAAHVHAEESLEFPKEQQWSVDFATAVVREGAVRETVQVTGELTTPPSGTAHVHAPVAGRIQAPRGGLPVPGTSVRQGQLLAMLAPTPSSPEDATRAGLAVVDAQTRVENARAELERVERLLADQAVPQRRLAEAQRALRVAEANLSAARSAQSLYSSARSGTGGGGWRITSPIAGVIEEVRCTPGEAVDPNELVFRVLDPETLWVKAAVPETWAARLESGADASFQLLGADEWHRLQLGENASLVTVGRMVDPRTRTVQVVYQLEGERDPTLRVGAALRVAVPVGVERRMIRVPTRAVLDVEGRDIVLVQLEGAVFEERPVRLGPSDGSWVGVVDGLENGERIVVRGGNYARLSGHASEVVGHGHVH